MSYHHDNSKYWCWALYRTSDRNRRLWILKQVTGSPASCGPNLNPSVLYGVGRPASMIGQRNAWFIVRWPHMPKLRVEIDWKEP